MKIHINYKSKFPLYKQLAQEIKDQIQNKDLVVGDALPSMNNLCSSLNISKETVKKAYDILRTEGFIDAAHGKGFFVKKMKKQSPKILIIFDTLNFSKKELFDSFADSMDQQAEYTIRLFNQDIDLFEKFIVENIGLFDYYVITPHLSLSSKIQLRVIKALSKIPNRQLVLLDREMKELPGKYISVYQDFESDVYDGLCQAHQSIQQYTKLNVFTMKGSLYGKLLQSGIKRYCDEFNIVHQFYEQKIPAQLNKSESYFILNGQLEKELIEITQLAKKQKLKIGKDIGLLYYNDSAINEIILNGLSVLSTDFKEMGQIAAQFIRDEKYQKVKCKFRFVKRSTF